MNKFRKIILSLMFTLCMNAFVGCSNKHPDIRNSNGCYQINVVGEEDKRKEYINIIDSDNNYSAIVNGHLYSKKYDKVLLLIRKK